MAHAHARTRASPPSAEALRYYKGDPASPETITPRRAVTCDLRQNLISGSSLWQSEVSAVFYLLCHVYAIYSPGFVEWPLRIALPACQRYGWIMWHLWDYVRDEFRFERSAKELLEILDAIFCTCTKTVWLYFFILFYKRVARFCWFKYNNFPDLMIKEEKCNVKADPPLDPF